MTIRFGILTLSDRSSAGNREDTSGPALAALIQAENWSVTRQQILPDLVVVFRGKRMIFPEEGTRFQVGDRLLLIASYDVWQNYKKHMYLNKKSEV